VSQFRYNTILEHLPEHLESLDVTCARYIGAGSTGFRLSAFPPTLTELALRNNASRELLLDVPFNPNMRYVYISSIALPSKVDSTEILSPTPHLGLLPAFVTYAKLGYRDFVPDTLRPGVPHAGLSELVLNDSYPLYSLVSLLI